MADFPDMSYRAKEARENSEKSIKKVTTGNVSIKKKSEFKKFADIFAPEDASNVKSYILTDIIVPGIKNAIADVVSIMLFGESGRIGSKKRNSGGTSYQRFYDDPRDRDRKDYNRPRGYYDFDDILFETRADAERVLDILEEAIATYGIARVADLYDAAGVTAPSVSYTANNYGWTNLRTAKSVRVSDGYILQLPKAIPIN